MESAIKYLKEWRIEHREYPPIDEIIDKVREKVGFSDRSNPRIKPKRMIMRYIPKYLINSVSGARSIGPSSPESIRPQAAST
jgi:hypothetical protein